MFWIWARSERHGKRIYKNDVFSSLALITFGRNLRNLCNLRIILFRNSWLE